MIHPKPLIAYYGDDFTGSTDALEALSLFGIPTVLFIKPPSEADLAQFPDIKAIGIAGMTRTMAPEPMEQELTEAFMALKKTGARHIHYKVCSTFDSSPTIGSIGQAIETGISVLKPKFVSLVVAAPILGRYCAFGNLFARMGIGSQGQIYRLDRHPSMSRHPVTPANESDLRLHLSKQTSKNVGLIDILDIEESQKQIQERLNALLNQGNDIVLFDAIYPRHLTAIGETLDTFDVEEKQRFSVGSSGVSMALGAFWSNSKQLNTPESWPDPGKAEPIIVASGSCSPITASQIRKAIDAGFEEIALDTESITTDTYDLEEHVEQVVAFIKSGKNVIIHTSVGPDDPRLLKTISGTEASSDSAQRLGTVLGSIMLGAVSRTNVKRIVIAGGDTSSVVARTLGIKAVEMIAPVSPGAPLCRAYAPWSPVNGLEVNFKGGQVGDENYFLSVLNGRKI